jgi:hypothetical protein
MAFSIDPAAYNALLSSLNNLHLTDKNGQDSDILFLSDDWWLSDTAVIENVTRRRGIWEIHLVFAHYKQPLKLLKRMITTTYCARKAALMAEYMKRLAAKDQRGTLKINAEDFNFVHN